MRCQYTTKHLNQTRDTFYPSKRTIDSNKKQCFLKPRKILDLRIARIFPRRQTFLDDLENSFDLSGLDRSEFATVGQCLQRTTTTENRIGSPRYAYPSPSQMPDNLPRLCVCVCVIEDKAPRYRWKP